MSVLLIVLYTAVVIVALLLIGVILIQPSKSGGFGGSFGGVGESVFGAHAMGHLSRLTVVLISLFFILTLLLAVITSHRAKEKSVAELNAIKSDLAAKSAVNVTVPAAAPQAVSVVKAGEVKPAKIAVPGNKAENVKK